MKRFIVVVTLLAFGLAGCGGTDSFQKENIGKNYAVSEVPYKGSYITCITRRSYERHDTGYAVFSISCDFVEYHKRVGQ